MLTVTYAEFFISPSLMLSVFMLNVVMLSVVGQNGVTQLNTITLFSSNECHNSMRR